MNSDDKGEESSGSGSAVTVILLDEADIVFDSESGFWSTVMELAIKSKSDSQCDTDGSHASCVFILLIVGAHPISAVASKQAYCTLSQWSQHLIFFVNPSNSVLALAP